MTLRPSLLASTAAWLALATGAAGCFGDAPHDNPLDPRSPGYRDAGSVEGVATGIYPPYDGRSGVRVRVVPLDAPVTAEHVTTTGPDGSFVVTDLPSGTYVVRAEAPGVLADADTTAVTAGGVAEVALRLDALPVVTAQAARTVHIESWFPDDPVFLLEVEATATDPDRASDLVGAELVADGLEFRAPLEPVPGQPGLFTATFDDDVLPGGRVQSLLGRTLHIEATDLRGNVGAGPPLALVRVIEQTPLTTRPQSLEVIARNPPVLEWRPSSLPFGFTYLVEVFRETPTGIPARFITIGGILPTETTLPLLDALPSGDYYWTVWVVDDAGNRSRSKEAGFRVP